MRPRGNRRGGFGNKRKNLNSNSSKFNPKRRKFNISRGGSEGPRGGKRENGQRRHSPNETYKPEEKQEKVFEEEVSESEEEDEDHMKQLLSTFVNMKNKASIGSSEESDTSDEAEGNEDYEDDSNIGKNNKHGTLKDKANDGKALKPNNYADSAMESEDDGSNTSENSEDHSNSLINNGIEISDASDDDDDDDSVVSEYNSAAVDTHNKVLVSKDDCEALDTKDKNNSKAIYSKALNNTHRNSRAALDNAADNSFESNDENNSEDLKHEGKNNTETVNSANNRKSKNGKSTSQMALNDYAKNAPTIESEEEENNGKTRKGKTTTQEALDNTKNGLTIESESANNKKTKKGKSTTKNSLDDDAKNDSTKENESANNNKTKKGKSTTKKALDDAKNDSTKENVEEIEVDLQNVDDTSIEDPFIKHIQYEMNDNLLNSVQSQPMAVTVTKDVWPVLGNLTIQIPKCVHESTERTEHSISDVKTYTQGGTVPHRIDVNKTTLPDIHIKTQITNHVEKANKPYKTTAPAEAAKLPLTPFQAEIFSVMNNYQDLFYPHRTFENGEELRFTYCLHAVNHILKTRTKVIHHNARLSKKGDVPEEFRDQGLLRPKILFIVPFRDAAYKIIKLLIDILMLEDKGNVINKTRFTEEFTGGELIMPKKNPKPEDYELLFCGNSSDDFKIGITVTKKSLKLYADFYSSDIIIASPLGLRYIIGAEGEAERDFDFMASIELLILDQTEVFLMQNWDHLLHALNHLHLQPKDSHGTDFSRVRTWSLNGWAKFYRQTLIFSSVMLPEINSVFNKKCFNYAGKVKVLNPVQMGTIGLVYSQLPHVYHKFEAHNVADCSEARFNFFISKILPQQKDPMMRQTLIYIPNYFDYVQLRNYFKKEDIGFVQICEYSKDGKVARARDIFFHGDVQFMLYTERYHFFNRKRIKGIRHLVFYQPPCFPQFYHETCNLMQEANMNKKVGSMTNMTVTILYSKYDLQQLSAIVGTDRALKMVSSDRNVHMLLTD